MNNTNNYSAEMSFEKAKRIFAKAWLPNFSGNQQEANIYAESLKLSQHELRLEVEINATSNSFLFGVTDQQRNSNNLQFITENRLTLQDSMVGNEYGLFVCNPSSRTATNFKLRTYGNTQDWTAADGLLIDSLYSQGALSIIANKDVVMPYRGLFNHWYKGQTQETAALGAASPDDQIRGAEDGMITWEPNILLIGSKGYQPIITLPNSLTGLAATFSRLVLIVRGVLAQNSTSVS